MPWPGRWLKLLLTQRGCALTDSIRIYCDGARHEDQRLSRRNIETFIKARSRWVPSPPLRARQRSGDWSQMRHPSTERIVDAAQHVYRVEYQRVPERYSQMQRWPVDVDNGPAERALPICIEMRTGLEVELDDIPRIEYRWFDLKCRCGVKASPREELLNRVLDELSKAHQPTISLALVARLTSNGY